MADVAGWSTTARQRADACLQEFRIVLGSHWTKGTGFVEGEELEGGDEENEMDED